MTADSFVKPEARTLISAKVCHLLLAPAIALAAFAGTSWSQNLEGISDREIVRRQQDALDAQKAGQQADAALASKDYEQAYATYLQALEKIPEGPASEKLRKPMVAKFAEAGLAYANELIANGRYSDAERVAKTILLPQFDPENRAAVRLLSNLEQPDYYNKTVTPKFAADRDQVVKLLEEGKAFFAAGRYDLAMKRYEQVLLVDPYNTAARKAMEDVTKQKSTFDSASYNETRSRMLWLVEREWERPVNRNLQPRATNFGGRQSDARNNAAIMAKLNNIVIPKIDFRDTSVQDAIDFLKQRSRDLDTTTDDPSQKRGVNIVLKLPPPNAAPATSETVGGAASMPEASSPTTASEPSGSAETQISLSLTNVPLIEALRYITELAKLKFKVEPYAVTVVPMSENTTDLVTKEYKVPPGFIPANTASTGTATSPASGITDVGGRRVSGRVNAKEYLEQQQVPFPTGAFAQYVPAGSKLIVRNTPDALDLIDYLVDAASSAQPTQVEIESKFLEITQNNLEELGFNWLMGPVSIGDGVYMSGGTEGFGTDANPTSPSSTTYPFVNSSGTPVGQSPLTGGLRSGVGIGPDSAVTANSIDALLGNAVTGLAPSFFGISGIFSNPQFQVVIRALSQKKGVDLMSAPKVTTKSGRKAVVKVVREFPYPTEFNPPEVPTTEGDVEINSAAGVVTTSGIVTPTTPTAFETRNLGVTLEVEPIIGPDNYTIDLNLSPEVVEFDGFINYGSPIVGASVVSIAGIADVVPFVITENVINQPIFSTRKVTTNVSVWDGQTVALGGLIREDVQKTNDKVPILGDIPIAGRLFRSNVDEKIKRNLIIFVTAKLMDAEGRPIRQDDIDQEEIVEPLGVPEDLPRPNFNVPSFGK